jgi:hypothetical protein
MQKYQAKYKTEIVTASQLVDPEFCASISFENIGADNASLNNDIPILIGSMPRKFENLSGVEINDRFIIKFAEASENRQILVIKTFYYEN